MASDRELIVRQYKPTGRTKRVEDGIMDNRGLCFRNGLKMERVACTLQDCSVIRPCVVLASYKRAGKVKTGIIGVERNLLKQLTFNGMYCHTLTFRSPPDTRLFLRSRSFKKAT